MTDITKLQTLESSLRGERFVDLSREQRRVLASRPLCEALLADCASQRHENPVQAIVLAWRALAVAAHLDRASLGVTLHNDILARTWGELGNCYRVAGQLHAAEAGLVRAERLRLRGTGDPLLHARVAELTASLRCDQRRFADVFRELKVPEAIYVQRGDSHNLGRILLQKGIYSGYDGDAEGSLQQLERALAMIDPQRDAKLTLSALHNYVWMLVENGKVRRARNYLGLHRHFYLTAGGRIDRIKLKWLDARIALGLEDLDRAEELLGEVRRDFERQGLCYHAALAGLDLAALWVRRGARQPQVVELLDGVVARFTELGVEREALGAVLLLRRQIARGELISQSIKMTFLTLQQVAIAARRAAAAS